MPYFVLVLLIAGCTTQMIADRLPSYRGQPVSAIIDKLGIPSDERVIAGRTVYPGRTATLSKAPTTSARYAR
jgi:hypothetical protein